MATIIPTRYLQLRSMAAAESVELGYASIRLAAADELDAAQEGYSRVPEGDATDWQDCWLVIGSEGLCGDPIFIDTNIDAYPVFTATLGMGEWNPRLISPSFESFMKTLENLRKLAGGRTNPVALERRPVSDEERKQFLASVGCDEEDYDESFWDVFLQYNAKAA